MNKQDQFKTTMLWLASAYDKMLTQEQMKTYWDMLKDYDSKHLAKAAKAHASDPEKGDWWPKASSLINWIITFQEADKRAAEIKRAQLPRPKPAKPTEEQKAKVRAMIKELKA